MFIKRNIVSLLPRLFDACFKQGVVDAYELANDYGCQRFVDSHKDTTFFSLLDDENHTMPWREWRFVLTTWCRQGHFYLLASEYLDKIKGFDCMWVALPICMDFYVKGVTEWLENPNGFRVNEFKKVKHVHWLLNERQNFKAYKRDEQLADAQSFAYDHIHQLDIIDDKQHFPNARAFETFCQMLWTMTRPLPKKIQMIDLGVVGDADIEKPERKPRYRKIKVNEHLI